MRSRPSIRRRIGATLVVAVACMVWFVPRNRAASHGPFPGFTGAPGEDTCRHCHATYALNPTGGALSITGFPETYLPGSTYPVTVTLANDTAARWGFQATVLTERNKRAGKLFASDRARTKVVPGYFITDRVYIEQKAAGSYRGVRGGVSWTFNWQAPKSARGALTIYVSGNAANDNGKSEGDFIYAARASSIPSS
jgi:hypothetical protein